jgi:hypothetical protein
MYRSLLGDSRLYELLLKYDEDLAASARTRGCPCGGVLHRASYARKPRGFTAGQPLGYDQRHSFCCAQDGCRRRTTPPSLRFLGPKVYLGAVVTLVTALRCGLNDRRVSELQQLVGASRRTLERWRRWWQAVVPTTPFFRAVRSSISEVAIAQLPASLLAHFQASDELTRIVRVLDFIKPLTTRSGWSSAMLG